MEDLPTWLSSLLLSYTFRVAASLALAVLCAMLAYILTRRYALQFVDGMAVRSRTRWDDIMVEHRVFRRLALFAPVIVFNVVCRASLPAHVDGVVAKVTAAALGLAAILALDALLSALLAIYRTYPFSRGRPIKGVVQMVKIFVFLMGGVWIIATLLDASPWRFISGIGALSAVLLLIFKDAILGLVASIQVSANNMVEVGDWIEMPRYGADGDVIDISLTTVKVQNWDKTISTIPTYALVVDPMKNWRGMSESGGRRIKRSIFIDMHTVRFCDEEMLDRFEHFESVAEYIRERRKEVAAYNKEHQVDTNTVLNGRRLTNLGCFRAYLQGYLRRHPLINRDMTFLVRHQQPTEHGLPIEIYVFCSDKVWANYEAVQADIFDHVLASIHAFDLAVFQAPAGRDMRAFAAQVGAAQAPQGAKQDSDR